MPIEVREKFDSRRLTKGQNPSAELAFNVLGTDDAIAARDALEDESDDTFAGLPRQSVSVEPLGPDLWDGVVRYGQSSGNLVLRGRPDEGYYVGIDLAKMEAKRSMHGDAFNIVIFGDTGDPNDFYVVPFAAVRSLFTPTPAQLRSTERPRWKVQIHNDEIAVAGTDQRINVAEFYADFAGTQEDSQPSEGPAELSNATVSDTQREGMVTLRRGHERFQREVLCNFSHKCCLTGVTERDLLVASHIVPWSRRVLSRLDPANGLCLFVTHDKLFDKGYFTLSDDLTVSTTRQRSNLSEHVVRVLEEIDGRTLCPPIRRAIRPEYLQFHRQHIFLESRRAAVASLPPLGALGADGEDGVSPGGTEL